MFSKVWKVFKEVAIGILLVLSLLLVISGVLKNSGIIDKPEIFLMLGKFLKKIEYGNVSDWISSLSTFGTFVVAIMALQTARKWIDGKNRDLAYVIANELFHNQFKEIEETNKNEVDSHEKPTQDIITIPNRMNATPHMAFYYNHLESLKNDYQRQSDRVITNYNKLKSYKWILKTTHLNNIERLIYLRKEQVFMFNEFTKLYDDMFKQTPFGLDEIEIFNEQAKALQNHHEKIKESFQDNSVFDILHLENLSPDQYFEITH